MLRRSYPQAQRKGHNRQSMVWYHTIDKHTIISLSSLIHPHPECCFADQWSYQVSKDSHTPYGSWHPLLLTTCLIIRWIDIASKPTTVIVNSYRNKRFVTALGYHIDGVKLQTTPTISVARYPSCKCRVNLCRWASRKKPSPWLLFM